MDHSQRLPSQPEKLSVNWHAVYTYPNHEKAVADQLEAKGIETYLPVTLTERRRKDRCVNLRTPIFPGYVFMRIDISERNKALCSYGVIRILSYNGRPIPINDKEIDGVRLCMDKIRIFRTQPLLEIGNRVRVHSGILKGLEGFITNCKKNKRLIVPITLTHQAISFEIDNELLEQIEQNRQ